MKPSPIKLDRAAVPPLCKSLEHSPQPDPTTCMSQYEAMSTCAGMQSQQQGGYISPPSMQQYTPMSQAATSMDYGSPSTCAAYDYQISVGNKSQMHDSMISPQPQHSPNSYYSPPSALHQVPVEGTITATNCGYNSYYPYGMSTSPSHDQTSPLSSQHSSPIMQHSPQLHPNSAIQTTLM